MTLPRRFGDAKGLVAGATSGGAQAPRGGYAIGARRAAPCLPPAPARPRCRRALSGCMLPVAVCLLLPLPLLLPTYCR